MNSKGRSSENLLAGRMTASDPMPPEAYQSTDYCDIGFRHGDGYGVAVLGTGRLVSDDEVTLNEERDTQLNQSILAALVRPDNTITVWAWYGQSFWADRPKRTFEVLDNVAALEARFAGSLSNWGRPGHPDFVLISTEPLGDDVLATLDPALRGWEKALGRPTGHDLSDAEREVGRLSAEIGIVAHISPVGMDASIVLFHSNECAAWVAATATDQATQQGRSLAPNPVMRWT